MSVMPSPFMSASFTSESLKRIGVALQGTQLVTGSLESVAVVAPVRVACPNCPSPPG